MRIVSRRDVYSALATGLTTGVIAWQILVFLGRPLPFGIVPSVLVWLVPLLWIAGVQLGYFLGQFLSFFTQFGKFAAIGFANAMVDFGVLYLFIASTGITSGVEFALFKAFAFLVALVHSYFWNKFWAFEAGASRGGGRELVSFAVVSGLALAVNVGVASAVVELIPAVGGLDPAAWAGIGAVAGSAAALVFSFAGFKYFVFRR